MCDNLFFPYKLLLLFDVSFEEFNTKKILVGKNVKKEANALMTKCIDLFFI